MRNSFFFEQVSVFEFRHPARRPTCIFPLQKIRIKCLTSVRFALESFCLLTTSFQGFERLHHWPTVFINFKTTVNKNAAVPRQTGNQDSPSRFLILIGLLVQNEFQSQYTRIENNLLLAALHVYSLTTGIFPKGTIPNLPGEHGNAPMLVALLPYLHVCLHSSAYPVLLPMRCPNRNAWKPLGPF